MRAVTRNIQLMQWPYRYPAVERIPTSLVEERLYRKFYELISVGIAPLYLYTRYAPYVRHTV